MKRIYEFHEYSECTWKLTLPRFTLLLLLALLFSEAHFSNSAQVQAPGNMLICVSRRYANALFVPRLNLLFRAREPKVPPEILFRRDA